MNTKKLLEEALNQAARSGGPDGWPSLSWCEVKKFIDILEKFIEEKIDEKTKSI